MSQHKRQLFTTIDGSVIAFNPTKLKLYRNCCQVRATLSGITTVIEP
ncbi:hypothetical protein AM588_10000699 [Phytophthora nicotianae]|uniref:Uncharacterized protein n=1 Tax=Phytophthora nicotianae TaxID=4792 RepID=A0A0W8CK40_PHYNI|nr:hypothetical protein AM588_10000699 [Phytophthora nicotianae]